MNSWINVPPPAKEESAFLRGVMAVCASLACDDQPGLACNLASRFGTWEDYRYAGCDRHDLRAFATSAGRDAIRRLRRGGPDRQRIPQEQRP